MEINFKKIKFCVLDFGGWVMKSFRICLILSMAVTTQFTVLYSKLVALLYIWYDPILLFENFMHENNAFIQSIPYFFLSKSSSIFSTTDSPNFTYFCLFVLNNESTQ